MNIHGIGVTVEVPKGAIRKGTDPDGKAWATKMPAAYGRIPRTNGADHEPIDAYIGPHVKSPKVYIVNQNDAESGDFDEHKVFLGFASKRQVISTYMAAFSDGKGGDRLGRVVEMSVPEFKEWLKSDTSKPHKFAAGGAVRHMQTGGDPGDWPGTVVSSADVWPGTPVTPPDIGQGTAAARGLYKGATANWGDELAGLAAAAGPTGRAASSIPVLGALAAPLIGGARLGYEALTGRGEGTESYEKARDKVRQQTKEAEEQYPKTTMGTEMVGALSAPVGGALKAGVPLAGKLLNAAKVGAGYGAVSGAGSGEGAEDTAIKTGVGTGVGALAGPLAVPIAAGAQAAGKFISHTAAPWVDPWVAAARGAMSPEKEAGRAVANTLEPHILEHGGDILAKAQAEGAPLSVADLGSQKTRDLARTSGNISSDAWDTISNFANGRFRGQYDRYEEFMRNLVGGKLDNFARKAENRAESRVANKPAYQAAYEAGDRPIWSPELERLSSSPTILGAARGAERKWKDWQVLDGMGGMNPPMRVENGGILSFGGSGLKTYPNIQYWDYVARDLAGKAQTARTAGNMSEAARYGGLEKALKSELDKIVPEFNEARVGAAKFFGADNAVDAGVNFTTRKMPVSEAQAAFARMTDAQKADFMQAYFAKRVADMKAVNYNADLAKRISPNPDIAAKDRFLLGDDGHKKLENFVSVEQGMDRLRTAMGNSTTAKQSQNLANALHYGLAGALGGDVQLRHDATLSPYEMGVAALLGGKRWVNNRVAARVAEMLVSDNPAVFAQGMKLVGSNQNLMNAFRALGSRTALPLTQQSQRVMPSIQGAIPSRADQDQPSP
jgi:hypothetical protein